MQKKIQDHRAIEIIFSPYSIFSSFGNLKKKKKEGRKENDEKKRLLDDKT